jgi:outer membrane scaffolding protein for murein synthesis (MipA/OmpV family)
MRHSLFIALVLALPMAQAAVPKLDPARPPPADWRVQVGAGTIIGQRSLGSDQFQIIPVPFFDVTYQDWFYANPYRGIGVRQRRDNLSGYFGIGVDFNDRDPEAEPRFAGLNRIPETPAIRTGVAYRWDRINLSADVSSRLGSGKGGTQIVLDVGSLRPLNFQKPNTLVGGGVFATLVDNTFAQNLVSVSAAEAARSGLPAFNASGGLLNAGVRGQIIHRFDSKWSFFGQANLSQLLGDAARSPTTTRKLQLGAQIFLSYQWQ